VSIAAMRRRGSSMLSSSAMGLVTIVCATLTRGG
jgi:hypothetical protein